MIKGINRQIIELGETSSTYYERAWLIVRPEYANLHQSILEKEAKKLLKETDAPSCMKLKRNFLFWVVRLGIAAGAGAGLTLMIQHLLT